MTTLNSIIRPAAADRAPSLVSTLGAIRRRAAADTAGPHLLQTLAGIRRAAVRNPEPPPSTPPTMEARSCNA